MDLSKKLHAHVDRILELKQIVNAAIRAKRYTQHVDGTPIMLARNRHEARRLDVLMRRGLLK